MSNYNIQILKKRALWYWRLVASNGRVLAHSEQYSSKSKARRMAMKFAVDVNVGKASIDIKWGD